MYEAGNVAVTLLALVALGFALDYALGVRWWTNPGGRLVMATLIAFVLMSTLVAVRVWAGDFFLHELVRLVVYAMALATLAGGWVLHRTVRRGKHRQRAPR
ncbi:hypothetical protein KGD82_13655 [Nocardiopsis eucommiae]|uniref:Uncharacterized protein n=1 Tax=Nocardiopsis eucommiae TaxID=2831970 RepID=A0A975LCG4_9ACTN|nr:hypothetical protein KGD82_13655 [Nocardiopsis eucommiae]